MKSIFILLGLVNAAFSGSAPSLNNEYTFKSVDAEFIARQKTILSLLYSPAHVDINVQYYKVGSKYSIEDNINNYTNKKAVEEFLALKKTGFLPKANIFSVFYQRPRQEAITLYYLFYYAKDFETFYKTAAYARVYLNEGLFLYAYYIAVIQRPDTNEIILPAPYEVYPALFLNSEAFYRNYRTILKEGPLSREILLQYGVEFEENYYLYYSNYSSPITYGNQEHKIAYFTEDVGLNSFYYYNHIYFPFWLKEITNPGLKERRGEIYYYTYQQLISRYYLERLSNGLGEISEFSWEEPIKNGYYPILYYYFPFVQRSPYYEIPYEKNVQELQFLGSYEKIFLQYIERGHFKAYNQEINLFNPKSINFVGTFWESNSNLYENFESQRYHRSYDEIARRLLGGAPDPIDKYTHLPTALDFYQTSLRDPVFYQLYSRILKYVISYKTNLRHYDQEDLHYAGVKIKNVQVDKLVTFFDFFDFGITNPMFVTKDDYQQDEKCNARQTRLNHEPFTVTVDVKSDVEHDAVFKIFLAPKYDSKGYEIKIGNNWMNFFELDWFVHRLTPGQNKIERNSTYFYNFKKDFVPISKILSMVDEGKIPHDYTRKAPYIPNRFILPKGTKSGFPLQLLIFVYPYEPLAKEWKNIEDYVVDNKPFGYPFDRPATDACFSLPNMYFKDVSVYHKGKVYPYEVLVSNHKNEENSVIKH